MPRRNLTLLALALAVMLLCVSRAERNPYARYASRGFRLIDDLALEAPTDHELLAGAMQGMVAVLRSRGDEHSAYIEPRQAKPLLTEMRQEFGGIGVRIRLKEPDETAPDAKPRYIVAESPEPGTPAFHGGVQAGDEIVAVNGQPLEGLPMLEMLNRMRGKAGKSLTLTLRRQDEADLLTVRLVREVILLPSILGDQRLPGGGWQFQLEQDSRIALVRLTSFGNRTVEELAEQLALLEEKDVEAIVLDLRNNPGGALDAAVGVSDLFLPANAEVLSTRGRDGEVIETFSATAAGDFEKLPVVVLIDRNTASAAEIVAACLQDHDRAVVIGERSFGKGTVQQLLSLEAGRSLLKLTSASYWRPSGVNIHRLPDTPESATWGVSPDAGRVIAQTEEELAAWGKWRHERDLLTNKEPEEEPEPPATADRTLQKAIEYLQSQLSEAFPNEEKPLTQVISPPVRLVQYSDVVAAADSIPDTALNAGRAYDYLKQLCALGPRPSGSRAMRAQQDLLVKHFEALGAKVKLQRFKVPNPVGRSKVPMANLIAKWRPEIKQRILLCAHYDTRPFPDRDPNPLARRTGRFVGANDGASGTALLMELAHLLQNYDGAWGVDVVLFDGEELVYQDPRDPYFLGSQWFGRRYAKRKPKDWSYRWAILFDMVGDADLQLYWEKNSYQSQETRPLVKELWATAQRLGVKEFIPRVKHEVLDDHLALRKYGGIPAIDLIDFDYPYWHTEADMPRNCSGESLVKVGRVVWEWLQTDKAE